MPSSKRAPIRVQEQALSTKTSRTSPSLTGFDFPDEIRGNSVLLGQLARRAFAPANIGSLLLAEFALKVIACPGCVECFCFVVRQWIADQDWLSVDPASGI